MKLLPAIWWYRLSISPSASRRSRSRRCRASRNVAIVHDRASAADRCGSSPAARQRVQLSAIGCGSKSDRSHSAPFQHMRGSGQTILCRNQHPALPVYLCRYLLRLCRLPMRVDACLADVTSSTFRLFQNGTPVPVRVFRNANNSSRESLTKSVHIGSLARPCSYLPVNTGRQRRRTHQGGRGP